MQFIVRGIRVDQTNSQYDDTQYLGLCTAIEESWKLAWTGQYLYVMVLDVQMTILAQFGPLKQILPNYDSPPEMQLLN